jgi:hypothetical protein
MGALTNIKRLLVDQLYGNGHHLNTGDDENIRIALDKAYSVGIHEDPKIREEILRVKKERRKGERRRV